MNKYLTVILLLPLMGWSQEKADWINQPMKEWPTIAMINEVWYENGDRYVHESFQYGGTGFLIDTGTDTLAATAKHILWIAQPKGLKQVQINDQLEKWWMHPKEDTTRGVWVDQLLNQDSLEFLQGPSSSIGERDWLVFSLKHVKGPIQPLKPRYTKVKAGEQLYFVGYPYAHDTCVTVSAKALKADGNRIVFTKEIEGFIGGASGSPIIDANGYLVGVLGGMSINEKDGSEALYGISTHYLKKVLDKAPHLNDALIPIGDLLWPIINTQGLEAALTQWKKLRQESLNHLSIDFLPETFNTVGIELIELGHHDRAIQWLQASYADNPWPRSTLTHLAAAYQKKGDKALAIQTYEKILKRWPGDEAALKALASLKDG